MSSRPSGYTERRSTTTITSTSSTANGTAAAAAKAANTRARATAYDGSAGLKAEFPDAGGGRSSSSASNSNSNSNGNSNSNSNGNSNSNSNKHRGTSPQPGYAPSAAASATSHKRTASGNPRSNTTSTNRAHVEERERRTERVITKETIVTRVKSPDRRERPPAPAEKPVEVGGGKHRQPAAESRPREKEPKSEVPSQAPWEPEATLLPHTSAPLASRISIPPLASGAPLALQPKPLYELSLEAQEAVLLEDLLFVFMGYEGQYIRFAKGYNPHEERDRLSGPAWRILPGLDPSLQDLTQSMLGIATHYSALECFVDVQSRDEFGSVNHALCASVRRFLQDYLVLVAQLETQFLTDDGFTLHTLNIHTLPTAQMMAQLYALAHELLKRNALLDDETEDETSDDGADDFDHILEQLREGGDLVPGNMTGKKICKGGVVLGLITKRLESMSGDPTARALLTTLLRDASRPYMTMLNEWLHHGGINDPHAEFMIKEQKSIRRERLEQDYTDEYWERRYTIRDHDVPPRLEAVKDKVLLAGKYLNVVRECGGVDMHSLEPPSKSRDRAQRGRRDDQDGGGVSSSASGVQGVPTSFDDQRFLDNVNGAYAHANESLMRLLLTAHALPARLRSLKHYFFLDPSDYFSYFLELGASELRKPVRAVNTAKLQSLLDLVLRQPGSAVAADPFKEDVKVEMNEITLIKSLQRVVNITGIEQGETFQPFLAAPGGDSSGTTGTDKNATGFTSLQLDYSVPFPVSLVISRKTVWRYQALFRYLLSLRYLESQLSTTWQTHTGSGRVGAAAIWQRRSSSRRLEIWKRRVWTLRARMLVFVQQLLYFCTAEVIEPNWQSLMARLKARDVGNGAPGVGDSGAGNAAAVASAMPAPQGHLTWGSGIGPGHNKPLTRTVDELMQDHVDFLDTCLKECMLTNSKLLRIHSKLMQTCTIFAVYTNWLSRELEKADPDLAAMAVAGTKPPEMTDEQWKQLLQHAAEGKDGKTPGGGGGGKDAEARLNELYDVIKKWETNFSRHLQILLDALNHYAATETVALLSLCARLSTANQGTEYAGRGGEDESVAG